MIRRPCDKSCPLGLQQLYQMSTLCQPQLQPLLRGVNLCRWGSPRYPKLCYVNPNSSDLSWLGNWLKAVAYGVAWPGNQGLSIFHSQEFNWKNMEMTTQFSSGSWGKRLCRVYIGPYSGVLHTQQLCLAPPLSRTWSAVNIPVIKPDYHEEVGLLLHNRSRLNVPACQGIHGCLLVLHAQW